nr:D-lyxose/D-mannose family sugar isomerase [Candidatus Sigynarchaeota archaeon]
MPLSEKEKEACRTRAKKLLDQARIVVTQDEVKRMEIADFNLSKDDFASIGLSIIVYENNDRYCAKELILFPGQTCPEHFHPDVGGKSGKQETFRCRFGTVYLYVDGEKTKNPSATIPAHKKDTFTAWHEIVLQPGDQHTLSPNTLHWFQAGHEGAIISEFSSTSTDENDIFTDPAIKR